DLLDCDDIFDGAPAIEAKTSALKAAAREELSRIEAMGGAIAAVEQSYMKRKLVESNSRRLAAIEAGEQKVVGVNCFIDSAPSPLTAGADGGFLAIDPAAEAAQIESLAAWRQERDGRAAAAALAALKAAAGEGRNIMEPSIACAHARVTTGEWGQALREIYGEYRAPTGVGRAAGAIGGAGLAPVREAVEQVSA